MGWSDVVAALGTLADVVGEGFVALTMGWAVMPAGIGFLFGAVLIYVFGSVVPVSFEVISLTMISKHAERDWKKMAYIVLVAGILGVILGIFGVYGTIVSFIEGPILSGMMTGVGIFLCFIAIDFFKENKIIGGTSIGVALITFFAFSDDPNNLIYALGTSVLASIIVGRFVPFEPVPYDKEREKIKLIPLNKFSFLKDVSVIRGALALLALRTGSSITCAGIDGQMANITPNFDHVNIIAGLTGAVSALFGGTNLEPIISGTAAAPNPISSAVLMMTIAGVLLLLGLLPWLTKYVPGSAVSGFLIIIGAAIAIPDNITGVISATDAISGPITIAVTVASFDPFLGMVAGILVRLVSTLLMGA